MNTPKLYDIVFKTRLRGEWKLEKKINYFKTYEIEDLKDMLEKTAQRNEKKVAFKLKNEKVN